VKRFLWAAVLALFIHVLLFGYGGRFFHKEIVKPISQPLSFTLVANNPKPDGKKPVQAALKSEVPQPPEPEKASVLPLDPPPPVVEEKPPEKEEMPEIEKVPEKEEMPEEEPPEPEKVIPKVKPPAEEEPVKIHKPIPRKKAVPKAKPVRMPKKKVRPKKKTKTVKPPLTKKKSARAKPKTIDTPEVPVSNNKGMTSEHHPDVQPKNASADVKAMSSSAPKVVSASPAYATNPKPKYPRVARRRGYEGVVLLKVLVDQEGRVDDALVLKSSGHNVLDRSALKAVKNWVFKPGTIDGKPMEMWVQVPVRFELKGR
jgi:periplasmic protein TonB